MRPLRLRILSQAVAGKRMKLLDTLLVCGGLSQLALVAVDWYRGKQFAAPGNTDVCFDYERLLCLRTRAVNNCARQACVHAAYIWRSPCCATAIYLYLYIYSILN
eukprot:COSAG02_NODE_5361_length_4398_cov_2.302163_2_plen_105_part_00